MKNILKKVTALLGAAAMTVYVYLLPERPIRENLRRHRRRMT